MFPTMMAVRVPRTPHKQLLASLPAGRQGIRFTLAAMRRFVDQYKTHPLIRQLSTRLTANLHQKDYQGEAERLFDYVQFRVRYVRDTNGVELLQTPVKTLELASGDCDDKSTLLAAMLESIGFKTRFRAIGIGQGICHVLVEVWLNNEWVSCDTTEPDAMGWYPPGIVESEYMHGFFSKVVKRVKKAVKGVTKAVTAPIKAVADVASGGDPMQALKNSVVDQYKGMREVHKAVTPKKILEAEQRLTARAGKLLSSPLGNVVTNILRFIPITAPFAWAASIARVVAIHETTRQELNDAFKKASVAQKNQYKLLTKEAVWVYDPAIRAIRLKKPGTGDNDLPVYRYDSEKQELILVSEGKINTDVSAGMPNTDGVQIDEYGDLVTYAESSPVATGALIPAAPAEKISTADAVKIVGTGTLILLTLLK